MADPGDEEDYGLEDEELVDFEGSDYGFESAEEETTVAPEPPLRAIKPSPAPVLESGEILDIKDGQGDGVAVQPSVVVFVDHPPKQKLPPKPDLEDGELDDAAMPEGSDPEAVANGRDDDEGEKDRRERKRRKDRYAAERPLVNKGRRDVEEPALSHSRHFRGHGSEEVHGSQRKFNFKGTEGSIVAPFQQRNSVRGTMGPGSPPVSIEYGGNTPFRSINRGFPRPMPVVVAPGRLNQCEVDMQKHIRDSIAVQEHALRHQQLLQMVQEQVQHAQVQAAQAQAQVQARSRERAQTQAQAQPVQVQAQVHMAISGALRPSTSGSTSRPIMGLDRLAGQVQASHSMLHLQVQTPDLGQKINFPRPSEDFSAVRSSLGGPPLNQPSNRERTAAGRQLNSWSPSPAVQHEILSMPAVRGRAPCHGQGQVICPLWGEPVGGTPAGLPSPLGVISHIIPVNGSPGIATQVVVALGTPKRQGSLPMMMANHTATTREISKSNKVDIRPQSDGTWRRNGGNLGSNYKTGTLVPSSWSGSVVRSNSSPGQAGNKRSRENRMGQRHSLKPALYSVGNGMETTRNNFIQLGGPVTKSRVLSVSGFPENTSMAVVVEAFEKQGKILDFRKDENGNAFHITFSSVVEAVSAKRFLHRTFLNGRQITVGYRCKDTRSGRFGSMI